MTKTEIIAKTLKLMNLPSSTHQPYDDSPDYEEDVIKTLESKLPDGDIKTCGDFKHLDVKCCKTCYEFYPQFEMSLISLPDGGKAWVCDAVKWALYPDEYQKIKDAGSEFCKLLWQNLWGERRRIEGYSPPMGVRR